MCAPKMPTPPDPYKTANAQGNINQETAYAQQRLNQTNQVTPYGSLTYTNSGQPITYNKFNQKLYDDRVALSQKKGQALPDPNSPLFNTTVNLGDRWDAVQTLSPEQQAIYDKSTGLQTSLLDVGNAQFNRVGSALSSPLSFGSAPPAKNTIPGGIQGAGPVNKVGAGPAMQSSFNNGGNIANIGNAAPMQETVAPSGAVQRLGAGPSMQTSFAQGGPVGNLNPDDYYTDRARVEDALNQRMDPILEQRREQERTRLLNMGFADPTSEGYSNAIDEVYRAENDARLGAILNAGQEQSRLQSAAVERQGFNNQAAGQRFGQNAAAADFANQANQQAFQNRAATAGFNNQAQAQQYGQNVDAVNIANAARQQNFENAAATAGFNNANQGQRFSQNATMADFANQARQLQHQNAVNAAGFNNQVQAQQFGQNTAQLNAQAAAAAFQNQARQQAIQEQMLLRQTPINEISALMSGSQVQQPNFVNTPQSQIQAPDLQGAIYANYDAQMQQAAQQAQANSAMTQGLFGLGSSSIGAFGAINPFKWGK